MTFYDKILAITLTAIWIGTMIIDLIFKINNNFNNGNNVIPMIITFACWNVLCLIFLITSDLVHEKHSKIE